MFSKTKPQKIVIKRYEENDNDWQVLGDEFEGVKGEVHWWKHKEWIDSGRGQGG